MRPRGDVVVGAFLVLVIIGWGFTCVHFLDSWCGSEVVSRTPSPDGYLEAVLYEANCGATTDFGTHVAVVRAGTTIPSVGVFDGGPTLLVADSDHGRAPLDSGHVIRVRLRWVSSDSLVVQYDRRARIYQQRDRSHGVSVTYEPVAVDGA